jgi:predicted transglutaminase-like cysteine proteinase
MIGGMLCLAFAPTAEAAKFGTLASNKSAKKNGLFGSTEIRSGSFKTLPKWTRVLKKMTKQKAELAACSTGGTACPPGAAKAWSQIIKEAKGLSKKKQLIAVNRYFNRWPYKLDQAVYKVSDYWATPFEFLKLSGDCEDYSIAKFYALMQLGWANDDLRVVALVDRIRGVAHAVLAVKLGDKTLILDNVSNIVTSHLLYKHYIPHYSVNETTKWSHLKVTKKRK